MIVYGGTPKRAKRAPPPPPPPRIAASMAPPSPPAGIGDAPVAGPGACGYCPKASAVLNGSGPEITGRIRLSVALFHSCQKPKSCGPSGPRVRVQYIQAFSRFLFGQRLL